MDVGERIRFKKIAVCNGKEFRFKEDAVPYIYSFDEIDKINGFEQYRSNPVMFRRLLSKNIIETAYVRNLFAVVDGYSLQIGNYVDGKFSLMPDQDKEAAEHFGVEYERWNGMYSAVWMEDKQIENIFEARTPIEGFPFKTEPKVYLKKDGIWLDESYKPSGN